MIEKGGSYIFGIISLVMAFFVPLAGIVFGIIGLVQNKKEKGKFVDKAKKMNILGIIIGAILYVSSLLLLIFSQGLFNLI